MWGTKEIGAMTTLAGLLFASGLATAAVSQENAHCPMAGTAEHQAQVDRRHDDATGVAHEGTVHHFLLADDGGSIRLEVTDSGQIEARDRIREHLQHVARSFAAGDFALPMLIHDRVPPGVEVMKERRSAIRYSYAPSANGGAVRISTPDAGALQAIHEFLRFQIRDHGTDDPTE
jgi:hypothetical protein